MHRRAFLALAAAGVGSTSLSTERAASLQSRAYAPLGRLDVPGAKEAVAGGDGETAFVATTDGFAIVDASDPSDPARLAERRDLLSDREDGPLVEIYDVAVDGDRLLVVGPAHGDYPLNAALLFDVSDPSDPARLAVHETDFAIHNAFLDGSTAYLTDNDGEANHLVVVDVTEPAEIGRWSLTDRDEAWLDVPPALRAVHDVWVRNGTAVVAYWDAGTVLLDVSDPASPSFLARIGERSPAELADAPSGEALVLPGNHHYSRLDPTGSVLVIGEEAWSDDRDEAPGGIQLWDVSTPTEPSRLARIPPPPTPDPSQGGTWTTAHNFDLHGDRLYSSWYQGGVKIHDVSDPADPVELAWWRMPDEARFWTAVHASECVVASDMGVADSTASIYTFPDRSGTQPDAPSLTTTPSGDPSNTPSPTSANSATPTATATSAPTATEVPTASPTATPTSTEVPTASSTPTETVGQPGFGVTTALGTLGLGALLGYLRR